MMHTPNFMPDMAFLQHQVRTSLGDAIGLEVSALTVMIGSVYGIFAFISLVDLRRLVVLVLENSEKAGLAGEIVARGKYGSDGSSDKSSSSGKLQPQGYGRSPAESPSAQAQWSYPAMACLMGYRLYSGFNSATWLPYLLAREGEDLWADDQAAFMGCAKLIYGVTMLLNPAMGLFGDRAVALSHGLGRRVFVRFGVVFASIGIFICMLSDAYHNFYTFMFGILVWRLGETMNDVTVEAIAPEMVPANQWPQASAVKAFLFLGGGLVGYVLLIVLVNVHYSWLYLAYLIGMIACCSPVLFLLRNDEPLRPERRLRNVLDLSAWEYLTKSYISPAYIPGGFPYACLSVFVFSLGTAPMFFILLMVRDLLDIQNEAKQQVVFAYLSLEFFLAAAVASVLAARSGRNADRDESLSPEQREKEEDENWKHRSKMLLIFTAAFAAFAVSPPFSTLFPTEEESFTYWYAIALVWGFSFGSAYTRFQDCTWQLLPPDADLAHSMGFNVMSRNAGLGAGNFLAGVVLDCFSAQPHRGHHHRSLPDMLVPEIPHYDSAGYTTLGYYVMCGASGLAVLASVYFANIAVNFPLQDLKSAESISA